MEPLVTILLATHNRQHLISQTLESILAQTYSNWECIIVDDFSTDSTKEIIDCFIKKDGRFFYYLKSKEYKQGLPETRNFGLDIAEYRNAKYIQFFDDDDIMHPEKLKKQMDIFVSNTEIEIVNCKYQGFQGDFELSSHVYVGEMNVNSENLSEDFLLRKIRIHSIGPIFKFNLFEGIRFDAELNYYAEEEELYLRLFFLKKPKYFAVNEFLFFYRHHGNSITASKDNSLHKIGSIVRMYQKLWDFLAEKKILNQKSIIFFVKYFLFYHYDYSYLNKIKSYLKLNFQIGFLFKKKMQFLFFVHGIYIKIINKTILR
ncbi:glycosyltransferase involved in cell wall biosynthesis [Flavobacterium sp. 28A]|uniref:glycosyltransferase family 2 protein n=1 Tax=Flavobacterium sp. 28A TaxID=2735895 RepID=UPI00156E9FAA|nr:glycosyltransferase family 2 protein [Flavobacterium sp. 28A]NRT15136.1 glycosyltransferase involved in cell wall biosynthesis [Flavobacterium sp. 28A]